VRVVGVGLEHRGAAAAQCAVGEQLDRADGEEIIAVADQRTVRADDVEGLAGVADHRVDARGQLVRVGVLPVEPVVVQIDAGIADAGEADAGHLGQRRVQRSGFLRRGQRRHVGVDQLGGGVDEHAGRIALRVALDASASRVGSGAGDAGELDRCTVGPRGVAVHAAQPHRPVGDRGIELAGGGEAAEFPDHLVPAAAADPFRLRMRLGVGLHLGQRFVQ